MTSLKKHCVFEARGFAGGIWLFWNDSIVSLDTIAVHDHFIHCFVQQGDSTGLLSTIYASPHLDSRTQLWNYLSSFGASISMSWLLIGDFNQIFSSFDKFWGQSPQPSSLALALKFINSC